MLINWEIFTLNHTRNTWTDTHPDLIISDSLNKKLTPILRTLLKLFRISSPKTQFNRGFLTIIKFYMKIMNNLQEKYGCLFSVVDNRSLNLYKKLIKDSNSKICTRTLMMLTSIQLLSEEAVWKRTFIKLWRLFKDKLSWNLGERTSQLISILFCINNWVQLEFVKFSVVLITIQTIVYIF